MKQSHCFDQSTFTRKGGRILRLEAKKIFPVRGFFPLKILDFFGQVRLFSPKILELFPRRGFFPINGLSRQGRAKYWGGHGPPGPPLTTSLPSTYIYHREKTWCLIQLIKSAGNKNTHMKNSLYSFISCAPLIFSLRRKSWGKKLGIFKALANRKLGRFWHILYGNKLSSRS